MKNKPATFLAPQRAAWATGLAACLLTALACTAAQAKLPPLSDDAKAKAAEAAAKAAHGNSVANFQLCRSMDNVAAGYFAKAKQGGKSVKEATKTDACAEPAPFVYVPAVPAPAPVAAAAPAVAGAAAAPAAPAAPVAAAAAAAAVPSAPAAPTAPAVKK
jgi:hypothetical protein